MFYGNVHLVVVLGTEHVCYLPGLSEGKYDFSWLDRIVDYARAKGLNILLETDYGNPI
ncbi:MAG: beta-galactosidase, partial [Treponema sp.]|nr:beta-galactosidase [Treponema sp.]